MSEGHADVVGAGVRGTCEVYTRQLLLVEGAVSDSHQRRIQHYGATAACGRGRVRIDAVPGCVHTYRTHPNAAVRVAVARSVEHSLQVGIGDATHPLYEVTLGRCRVRSGDTHRDDCRVRSRC